MTSKSPVRSAEDIDETALSYAEVKALATGNPYIKEKMDLNIQLSKLKLLKANHLSQRYALEDWLLKILPQQIKSTEERIAGYEQDMALYRRFKEVAQDHGDESTFPGMVIKKYTYKERAEAGAALLEACKGMTSPDPQEAGSYLGFTLWLSFDSFHKEYRATLTYCPIGGRRGRQHYTPEQCLVRPARQAGMCSPAINDIAPAGGHRQGAGCRTI